MPKILRDSDGIYKAYYNEVSRQFEEPSPALDSQPHIRTHCYSTEAAARNALGGSVEIVDGGYRESTAIAEPISDKELEQELGRLSIIAGVPIPKSVLSHAVTTQSQVTEQVSGMTAMEATKVPDVFEKMHLTFLKKCAKLSVTKSKAEQRLIQEYLNGYMDAVDPRERATLSQMASELL